MRKIKATRKKKAPIVANRGFHKSIRKSGWLKSQHFCVTLANQYLVNLKTETNPCTHDGTAGGLIRWYLPIVGLDNKYFVFHVKLLTLR